MEETIYNMKFEAISVAKIYQAYGIPNNYEQFILVQKCALMTKILNTDFCDIEFNLELCSLPELKLQYKKLLEIFNNHCDFYDVNFRFRIINEKQDIKVTLLVYKDLVGDNSMLFYDKIKLIDKKLWPIIYEALNSNYFVKIWDKTSFAHLESGDLDEDEQRIFEEEMKTLIKMHKEFIKRSSKEKPSTKNAQLIKLIKYQSARYLVSRDDKLDLFIDALIGILSFNHFVDYNSYEFVQDDNLREQIENHEINFASGCVTITHSQAEQINDYCCGEYDDYAITIDPCTGAEFFISDLNKNIENVFFVTNQYVQLYKNYQHVINYINSRKRKAII